LWAPCHMTKLEPDLKVLQFSFLLAPGALVCYHWTHGEHIMVTCKLALWFKPWFHDDEIVDTFWLLDTLWKHCKDLGPDWPCHQCFCWYNCGSILHETSMFSAHFHWSHQPMPPVQLFLPIMLHPWNSIISSFCSL